MTIFKNLSSILNRFDLRVSVLIFSSYFTTFIGDLYYSAVNSPDFPKYSIYFSFFDGSVGKTNLEQNLSYYFLHSLSLSLKNRYTYEYNYESIFDSNIVMTNNIFYVIGILGIYKLLSFLNMNKNNIFFALILLNFFPPIFGSRLIYKPEILVFALLPWIIYGFEFYKENKSTPILFSVFFLGIFLFTIKPTSTAMCGIFLLFRYQKIIFKEFKKMIFLLFAVLIIFIPIFIEDYNANGYFYLNHPNEEVYSDQAPINFLYNINLNNLVTKPYQHNHADSLLGITLLDTFGDYYHLLWENDASLFKFNEYRFTDSFFINNFLEKYIGIIMTSLFYLTIIYFAFRDKIFRSFYLLPFFGILILLIISYTGNFQLQTGDVLKTSYYSFFLGLSFCFVIVKLFENKNLEYKIFFSSVFILLNAFIVGFPKINNNENIEYLNQNNVSPLICRVNDLFINGENNDCRKYIENVCEFNVEYKDVKFIRLNSKFVNTDNAIGSDVDFEYGEDIPKLVKNGSVINVEDKNTCYEFLLDGYKPIDKNYELKSIPYANLFLLITSFVIILFLQVKKED